jgi:hypothetical protein
MEMSSWWSLVPREHMGGSFHPWMIVCLVHFHAKSSLALNPCQLFQTMWMRLWSRVLLQKVEYITSMVIWKLLVVILG